MAEAFKVGDLAYYSVNNCKTSKCTYCGLVEVTGVEGHVVYFIILNTYDMHGKKYNSNAKDLTLLWRE